MSIDLTQWHEVEPYGPLDEGDIGGDIQVGIAWGRRFARLLPSGRWAVIDDAYYTVAENTRPGREDDNAEPNDIQNQVSFTVCRDLDDVAGTEEYADMQYEWADGWPLTDETARLLCAARRNRTGVASCARGRICHGGSHRLGRIRSRVD